MGLYLIAEIGINHNGDIDLAKKMIKSACEAGFDAVKFQKRTLDAVYTKDYLDSPRESPWGTTQRAQKQGLEFSLDQYREIDVYCKTLGMDWFASAWDVQAQKDMATFGCLYNKVASAMLANWPLLQCIAQEKKKTFISTGMATLEEIDQVVELFKKENCPFELMHCNSTYPMQDKDANLRCIPMLRQRYGCDVGYSGHESSLIKVCITAVALGATSLERHITLDRAMYGSDQSASIETHALKNFVEAVRAVPGILGSDKKIISEAETVVRNKLRVEVPACETVS
ncbi:MAG: N-acetylneuraminate synthase family protein [Coxiellaceae bacterium]|nr:N-acetylneuraminate synthase family protein [Coxiellaceae bacterium]